MLNNNKLVSILIPVYNREKYIEETVKGALKQTYKNIEVIVVDNKSNDKTWNKLQELAKTDNRIRIFQNETNIGPVRNWKRCIDEASGKYGKILWSDDLIAPDFIKKTLPFLENNEDVGFVFTGTEIFIDGTQKKSENYFIGKTGIYDSDKYINGVLFEDNYPVSPGCALFRMKDLKENLLINVPNKVNSNFSMHAIGNDLLIFLLTAHKYKRFAFINEKLSFFRAHKDSISIKSNNGKLPLHYSLAKAYFVENYRKDLIRKLNTSIWINIKRYPTTAKKYNLDKIEKFYLSNRDYKLDYVYLVNKVFKKILKKMGLMR
ncbi:glycosyltransferase family 2 protein [Deferribacter autotrophicus]|uniref:Glycosyltransferase family 2 protein n=1 Tax=Deferribacter autotrophicus TaxID=500465 RepID=A0A5A8F1M2_9BACT|nr:glycosyltransferase family 2 protein [Deferribacter autotrophicus]KAA0257631.1 glycosyltransferase family 2 protein [Deferribacter autotrophicus]